MPSFNAFQEGRSTSEIVLSRKNLNSASKVENWIIVDILKYLLILITGKLLASRFIRNGDC